MLTTPRLKALIISCHLNNASPTPDASWISSDRGKRRTCTLHSRVMGYTKKKKKNSIQKSTVSTINNAYCALIENYFWGRVVSVAGKPVAVHHERYYTQYTLHLCGPISKLTLTNSKYGMTGFISIWNILHLQKQKCRKQLFSTNKSRLKRWSTDFVFPTKKH